MLHGLSDNGVFLSEVAIASRSIEILLSCPVSYAASEAQERPQSIYHPGDTVAGFVRILSRTSIDFSDVSVDLQGVY